MGNPELKVKYGKLWTLKTLEVMMRVTNGWLDSFNKRILIAKDRNAKKYFLFILPEYLVMTEYEELYFCVLVSGPLCF